VSLRCGERATSLARALPPPHSTGLLPMCEVKCIAGTGRGPYREGQSNALCVRARVCIFSLSFARSSFHCGQSIAMNSCECSTTNTHSPSFLIRTASSLFDAKPLYTPRTPISVCSPLLACVFACILLRAHPDSKRIFTRFVGRTFSIRCVGQSH